LLHNMRALHAARLLIYYCASHSPSGRDAKTTGRKLSN
jgi:hypothetical protein